MKHLAANHYEQAFGSWLADNGVRFLAIDQQKRRAFSSSSIKSFDYLVYPPDSEPLLVEVKGRTFKGVSLEKLTGLDCWVTMDDCEWLEKWQQVFGTGHSAVFVFAYVIENIDIEFDGREVYDFCNRRYVFFCVMLDDYRTKMKIRSPKWKTVTLAAEAFRQLAFDVEKLIS